MPKRHLTDQFIKNLKPQDKRVEYFDQHKIDPETNTMKRRGVKGLLVRLTKAGNKYFYYSYWYDGKSKRYKIGDYPNIRLSKARDIARDLAVQVNNGEDPAAEKQRKKNKPGPKTFEYLVDRYKAQHLSNLRENTQRTYGYRIDNEIVPQFKGRAVKDITRGDVMELLEEIAIERGKHTHSNRVRAILSSIFSFAVQREIAEYNPVKSVKPLGKEIKRDRVYSDDEIEKLWEAFEAQPEPSGSVLKILLLLGQRKGETCRIKWEDINGDVWTIPKEHTKANRKHYVPLPPLATQIIESLDNDSPYVFESSYDKGEPIRWIKDAARRVREQTGIDDFRVHDLRRTAATYMAELGTDRTILGKVLNHKGLAGDSQVTARYDRYSYMDEKRKALTNWSRRLQQIVEGKQTEKVIGKIG